MSCCSLALGAATPIIAAPGATQFQAIDPAVSGGGSVTSTQSLAASVQQLTAAVAELATAVARLRSLGPAHPTAAVSGANGGVAEVSTSGGGPTVGAAPATLVATPASAATPATSGTGAKWKLGNLAPNQNEDRGSLSKADGSVACGPAAATAFARFMGKDVSLDEVAEIAKKHGWVGGSDGGMHSGSRGVIDTLEELGVKAERQDGVDWKHVQSELAAGRPVIVATEGHYWVAEGYNPQTGEYNFTETGKVVRGGKAWMTPEEVAGNGRGPVVTSIYLK